MENQKEEFELVANSATPKICLKCNEKIKEDYIAKIYDRFYCIPCAFALKGKKIPAKKIDPIRNQYKSLIAELNL